MYTTENKSWKPIHSVNYHTRVVMVPGPTAACFVVGGSQDPECLKTQPNVQMITVTDKKEITVTLKKPLNVPRGKIGLCVGQLKSEV